MPGFNSGQMLSSHEILRFAFDHSGMRLRHVGLYGEKVVISLRDDTAQSNLWEIVQVGQDVRLTRFPRLRPPRIKGPFGTAPRAGSRPISSRASSPRTGRPSSQRFATALHAWWKSEPEPPVSSRKSSTTGCARCRGYRSDQRRDEHLTLPTPSAAVPARVVTRIRRELLKMLPLGQRQVE